MAISLKDIRKPDKHPPRITVHGGAGVGKSTLAAGAPAPIFIDIEGGLGELDVPTLRVSTYDEVAQALEALLDTPKHPVQHNFKTLAIDSIDWLEALIWREVCAEHGVKDISAIPYGQGYSGALVYWRQFLEGITALRNRMDMTIIMICHSQIQKIEEPTQPPYDSYTLKLHKRAAALIEEFSDCIFFCQHKIATIQEDAKGFNQKRTRAIATDRRVLHTSPSPAFTAKSRMQLPKEIDLTWAALAPHLNPQNPAKPESIQPRKKEAKNG
jgi:hypothetical protein